MCFKSIRKYRQGSVQVPGWNQDGSSLISDTVVLPAGHCVIKYARTPTTLSILNRAFISYHAQNFIFLWKISTFDCEIKDFLRATFKYQNHIKSDALNVQFSGFYGKMLEKSGG
jgi:hypothetical protein